MRRIGRRSKNDARTVLNLYKDRDLKNVINVMKQLYPDFYAWLVFTYPEDEKTQE